MVDSRRALRIDTKLRPVKTSILSPDGRWGGSPPAALGSSVHRWPTYRLNCPCPGGLEAREASALGAMGR